MPCRPVKFPSSATSNATWPTRKSCRYQLRFPGRVAQRACRRAYCAPIEAQRDRGEILTSWVQAGLLAVFAMLYFLAPSTSPLPVLMRPAP